MKKIFLLSLCATLVLISSGCGNSGVDLNNIEQNDFFKKKNAVSIKVEWPEDMRSVNGAPPAGYDITTMEVMLINEKILRSQMDDYNDETLFDTKLYQESLYDDSLYHSPMRRSTENTHLTETYGVGSDEVESYFYCFDVTPSSDYYEGATIEGIKADDYVLFLYAINSSDISEFYAAKPVTVVENETTNAEITQSYWVDLYGYNFPAYPYFTSVNLNYASPTGIVSRTINHSTTDTVTVSLNELIDASQSEITIYYYYEPAADVSLSTTQNIIPAGLTKTVSVIDDTYSPTTEQAKSITISGLNSSSAGTYVVNFQIYDPDEPMRYTSCAFNLELTYSN